MQSVTGDLAGVLAYTDGPFSAYSLSDIASYTAPDTYAYLWRRIARTAAPGARGAECLYTLVAGQNTRMLRLMREHYHFGAEVVLPLTYVCIPAFRDRSTGSFAREAPEVIRARYLEMVRPTFVPVYRPECYVGHVESLCVDGAGCSIWTNEHLLAEEVVRLPRTLRILRALRRLLSRHVPLPHVPYPGEAIRSLFLYDLYAEAEEALGRLLDAVSTFALQRGYTVLYILLQTNDPLLPWVRAQRWVRFQFPYRLLVRGQACPVPDSRVYLDVRDL